MTAWCKRCNLQIVSKPSFDVKRFNVFVDKKNTGYVHQDMK